MKLFSLMVCAALLGCSHPAQSKEVAAFGTELKAKQRPDMIIDIRVEIDKSGKMVSCEILRVGNAIPEFANTEDFCKRYDSYIWPEKDRPVRDSDSPSVKFISASMAPIHK